eukprot:14176040-Alexandrium_andersonii.AAC.1
MSASLVGSEMCIRDSPSPLTPPSYSPKLHIRLQRVDGLTGEATTAPPAGRSPTCPKRRPEGDALR